MTSRIYAIRFPGSLVEGEREHARIVDSQLGVMVTALTDAAISLSWFEEAHERASAPPEVLRERWERRRSLRISIMRSLGYSAFDDDLDREESILKRGIELGEVPTLYEDRSTFIHARTFLFALDAIKRSLGALRRMQGSPVELVSIEADLWTHFPTLARVRDSAHHAEERAAGLEHGRPIDIKPVKNGFFASDKAFLILGVLNGDAYGYTSANGDYEEVAVNAASLKVMQSLVQRSVDSFTWTGPPRLEPRL